MAEIQPRHKLNTRISLKHDTEERWSTSNIDLYPGEIAISYDRTDLSSMPTNIKMKIGVYHAEKGRNLYWRELPFVQNEIDIDDLKKNLQSWVQSQARAAIKKDFQNPAVLSTYITTDTIPIGEREWYLCCGDSKVK